MSKSNQSFLIKLFVAITFIGMITVNFLANALPIAGNATGAISDAYPNLFAPQGLTFSIWGLIYLLVLGFTLYHLGLFRQKSDQNNAQLLDKIGVLFIISSTANIAWIFAWHYEIIPLSLVLMVVILVSLMMKIITLSKHSLTGNEKFFLRLPFSIYFGWITVATIANVTVLLISLGVDGIGAMQSNWTAIILVVGAIIGIATTIRFKDLAYGLVFIWAYLGIWMKHINPVPGFDGAYPVVINTAIVCIVLFVITEIYVFAKKSKKLD